MPASPASGFLKNGLQSTFQIEPVLKDYAVVRKSQQAFPSEASSTTLVLTSVQAWRTVELQPLAHVNIPRLLKNLAEFDKAAPGCTQVLHDCLAAGCV